MRICKYCKKPIQDNELWTLDLEGNGYHYACWCEMQFFILRDKQTYNKGKADILDKIRAEIEDLTYYCCEVHPRTVIDDVFGIIDKYKTESDPQKSEG